MKTMIATIKKDFDFKDDRVKYTFLSAIIAGFLAHGFMFSNKLSFHDDIGHINDQGKSYYYLGRWFMSKLSEKFADIFGGNYSLPWLIGIFSLVIIAIGAVLVVSLLELDHKIDCVLIGSLMAVFPTMTALFGYMWIAAYDSFSILLAIMAAYVLYREKPSIWKVIVCSVLLGLSLGIYQAFISVTAVLLIFVFIKRLIQQPNRKIKNILLEAGACVGTLALGLGAYLIVNKRFLSVNNEKLTSYQGIDEMGKLTLEQMKTGIRDAYHNFFLPVHKGKEAMFMGNMRYVYFICFGLIIVLLIANFVKIFKKNKMNACIYALAIVCIPLAYNAVYLMGASTIYHIMLYAQCMIFILDFMLIRYTEISSLFVKKVIIAVAMAVSFFGVFFYTELANRCYLKALFQQEETIGWATVLVANIKGMDGYTDEMKIAWIMPEGIRDETSFEATPIQNIEVLPYEANSLNNNHRWIEFVQNWCGFYQPEVEDYTPYENNAVIEAMPSYPDDGSIQIIDDVIVVKF